MNTANGAGSADLASAIQSAASAYPRAAIDHDTAAFFEALANRRLTMNVCDVCARAHHPPMPCCPQCWSTDVSLRDVPARGTIVLLTTARHPVPMAGLDGSGPHVLASVEFDGFPDARMTLPLVGTDAAIGDIVEVGWASPGGAPMPVGRPVAADSTAPPAARDVR